MPFVKPFCLIAALCLSAPLPALSQDSPLPAEAFGQTLKDTANAAGAARLPVSCGGLFRALRQVAGEGTEAFVRFNDMEADMAFFASAMRGDETGEELTVALDVIAPHMSSVSALYLKRMSANKKATGKILDPVISDNYAYCEGLNERLLGAMDNGAGDGAADRAADGAAKDGE